MPYLPHNTCYPDPVPSAAAISDEANCSWFHQSHHCDLNAGCIYKIAANMWRADRNRIACIANGSIGVAYNAIRPVTERRVSQASPSERKRIVFGSLLIANRALFNRAR